MNFKNKRVAILFLKEISNLPEEYKDWAIADFDAYLENLDLWAENDDIDNFFSIPIPGLKQHLAETKKTHVGAAGKLLYKNLESIKQEYLNRGYDVLELNEKMKYTQCTNEKVRISLT